MQSKIIEGYIPTDWTEVISKNLSDKDARKLEIDLLHKNGLTKFNMQSGDRNHRAKLTNKQVLEIFKRVKSEKPVDLAKEFNISKAVIYHIRNRTQWKTVIAGDKLD